MDWETRSFLYFFLACKARFYWMSREGIARYQLKKARQIARYAVAHAPYFRARYQGCDLDDVWHLPTTDKKAMMSHFTEYNTVGLTGEQVMAFCEQVERTRDFGRRLNGLSVAASSGTSGSRGVEVVTPHEETYLKSMFFARFAFLKGAKMNLAFILRVTSPAINVDRFGHRLTYISQLAPIERIRAQLVELQPNMVSAPPSMLRILAREREQGRLDIRPRRLIAYAEVLYPEVQAYLERVFDCPVHQIYKCTEGAIAMSCAQGRLHINEDLIAVQLYNADGTPTLPGQPCYKMVITDLHKTSQPIIRYELNDVITLSEQPCPCGSSFRVIEQIQGRADDLFWGQRADGSGLQFIFADYVRRAILFASGAVEAYQAIQSAPDRVLVRLAVGEGADKDEVARNVQAGIEGVFATYACRLPRVRVEFASPQVHPTSHKLVRIQRTFSVPADAL